LIQTNIFTLSLKQYFKEMPNFLALYSSKNYLQPAYYNVFLRIITLKIEVMAIEK